MTLFWGCSLNLKIRGFRRPWKTVPVFETDLSFPCKYRLVPKSPSQSDLAQRAFLLCPSKSLEVPIVRVQTRVQPESLRSPEGLPYSGWGVYQIGDEYARSWSTRVTSGAISIPKRTSSKAVHLGVGISSTRT
jgi:hypothetical protein